MLSKVILRLRVCERGEALVGVATLPLLAVSCALAFDTIRLGLWMEQMEAAARASAAAGAQAIQEGRAARPAADRALTEDWPELRLIGSPEVEEFRGVGAPAASAIRVTLASEKELMFLGAFLPAPPVRQAEAMVAVPPLQRGRSHA